MYPERVYELFAEWEQAEEEGTPFDLDQYADASEYPQLIELIEQLRPTSQCKADDPREIPEETSRYRFTDFIAQGGMGEVWRGLDKRLDRVVALKIRRNRWGVSAEKFREEAKLVSRLSHPGIAAVHDMDELPDGRPFFAMKLIEGVDLETFLTSQKTGKLNITECLRMFRQICEAVGYAHELTPPLIHRDLKPQNIMIGRHGEVYVMDWGIARVIVVDQHEAASESLRTSHASADDDAPSTNDSGGTFEPEIGRVSTIPGIAKGTVAYMAPEQARGVPSAICPATDVFCLGGILCRMLTGTPTFESKQQAIDGDVSGALQRLAAAEADPDLMEIVKKCLVPEISGRYSDANEVLRSVHQYESDQIERLRNAELLEARRQAQAAARRTRRRWQYSLGLLVVSLACIAMIANSRRQASEKQQADQREEFARDAANQLRDAKLLHKLATDRPLEISGFELAAKASRQAVNSAKLVGDADALSNAVALQEQIEAELSEVPRNVRFMTDLAAAQLPPIPRRKGDIAEIEAPTYELISNRYREAFRNRGFNFTFDTNVAEAKRRLNDLPKSILPDVAAHADQYWLSLAASPIETWPLDMKQKVQDAMTLAKELDSDPKTSVSRDLVRKRTDGIPPAPIDSKTLELLQTVDISATPPGHILVMSLLVRFQREGTAANVFLLRAARERPNDLLLVAAAANVCETGAIPDWRKAQEYRRAMMSLEPSLALGLAYDLLHDRRAVEPELIIRHLHTIRSPSAESYNALGVCLSLQEGRRDEERQMYSKSLELQPDFEPAQRNLKLLESDEDSPQE